jgi:hypothetical protein
MLPHATHGSKCQTPASSSAMVCQSAVSDTGSRGGRVSGPRTRKSRNLSADPRCSFAISLADLDLVLDGAARHVTHAATLTRVAERYADRGWPLTVSAVGLTASFWAPTAPPPPWHLYAFAPTAALAVATAPPGGATRRLFSNSSQSSLV